MFEETVRKIFEEQIKQKVVCIQRLGGLSNYVFKVTDTTSASYIFKILISEQSDPFKKMERHCLEYIHQIYPMPIMENQEYRIEHCIPCEETQFAEIIDPVNQLLILKAIARFNKLNKIKSDKPNLYYILDKEKEGLCSSIHNKLLLLSPVRRARCEEQMTRLEKVMEVLRREFIIDEMVLSHNDLFYRNIIFDQQRKVFQLIDFEYVGYNPLGMDIFQFINEWLIDYNYPQEPYFRLSLENYPGDDQIRMMIHFYLFFYKHPQMVETLEDNGDLLDFVRNSKEFTSIDKGEIQAIFDLFPYFGVITNIYWYYWALRIFKIEGINFDYVDFAEGKFKMITHFLKKLNNSAVTQVFQE